VVAVIYLFQFLLNISSPFDETHFSHIPQTVRVFGLVDGIQAWALDCTSIRKPHSLPPFRHTKQLVRTKRTGNAAMPRAGFASLFFVFDRRLRAFASRGENGDGRWAKCPGGWLHLIHHGGNRIWHLHKGWDGMETHQMGTGMACVHACNRQGRGLLDVDTRILVWSNPLNAVVYNAETKAKKQQIHMIWNHKVYAPS
jgi:hypothetical protein